MSGNKIKLKKKKRKPKETPLDKPTDIVENKHEGLPDRDLKKNLGCG